MSTCGRCGNDTRSPTPVSYEMKLYLGIVKDDTGKVVNHRSMLKVILNPLLRMSGWQIATDYDIEADRVSRYVWCRCPRVFPPQWAYKPEDGYTVQRQRWII